MAKEERSSVTIRFEDLKALQEIALKDLDAFVKKNPDYKPFQKRLLCITLCHTAAQHYLDRKTGVKDFDVYYFFKESKDLEYPYRRSKKKESKLEKFGPDPEGKKKTRLVEMRGREIPQKYTRKAKSDPVRSIELFLEAPETETAQEIGKQAVVGLWPDNLIGKIIWSV